MPLTKLNDVTALVIIDLQKGIAAMAPQAAGDVISRSARLARAFREKKLPVVLVNVAGAAPGRTDTPRPMVVIGYSRRWLHRPEVHIRVPRSTCPCR